MELRVASSRIVETRGQRDISVFTFHANKFMSRPPMHAAGFSCAEHPPRHPSWEAAPPRCSHSSQAHTQLDVTARSCRKLFWRRRA
eukprot:4799353-Prymnesium_polylepis.1